MMSISKTPFLVIFLACVVLCSACSCPQSSRSGRLGTAVLDSLGISSLDIQVCDHGPSGWHARPELEHLFPRFVFAGSHSVWLWMLVRGGALSAHEVEFEYVPADREPGQETVKLRCDVLLFFDVSPVNEDRERLRPSDSNESRPPGPLKVPESYPPRLQAIKLLTMERLSNAVGSGASPSESLWKEAEAEVRRVCESYSGSCTEFMETVPWSHIKLNPPHRLEWVPYARSWVWVSGAGYSTCLISLSEAGVYTEHHGAYQAICSRLKGIDPELVPDTSDEGFSWSTSWWPLPGGKALVAVPIPDIHRSTDGERLRAALESAVQDEMSGSRSPERRGDTGLLFLIDLGVGPGPAVLSVETIPGYSVQGSVWLNRIGSDKWVFYTGWQSLYEVKLESARASLELLFVPFERRIPYYVWRGAAGDHLPGAEDSGPTGLPSSNGGYEAITGKACFGQGKELYFFSGRRPSVLTLEPRIADVNGDWEESLPESEKHFRARQAGPVVIREHFLPRGSGEVCFLLPVTVRGHHEAAVLLTFHDPGWRKGIMWPLHFKAFVVVPKLDLVTELALSENASAFLREFSGLGSRLPNFSAFDYNDDSEMFAGVSTVPNSAAMYIRSGYGVLFVTAVPTE